MYADNMIIYVHAKQPSSIFTLWGYGENNRLDDLFMLDIGFVQNS